MRMSLSGPRVCTSSLSLPILVPLSLHWPQDPSDLGKYGISYLEILIMFEEEQWASSSSPHVDRYTSHVVFLMQFAH